MDQGASGSFDVMAATSAPGSIVPSFPPGNREQCNRLEPFFERREVHMGPKAPLHDLIEPLFEHLAIHSLNGNNVANDDT